ncbi:glycosyltransferase family 4 protein [Mycobacterium sp. E740]|uniref:glycosyltransferase family 4 protein n=1 Tax=Mycobacterium sp. E740 TaxID=1834149 RepID=UPI000800DA33|nr:glycosyltransferase family 4 protein [Mycobacterium sp. E740]OBI72372.1 glycosyl transferase family 1 [Mycobacterium sp. E740]
MRNSVALISAVDPYPSDAGKKVVLAGFVEYLAERVGSRNVHYVLVGEPVDGQFPVTAHCVAKPAKASAMGSLLSRTLTGRSSMQEALLNTADLRDAIHRTLADVEPDLTIYDTVRMAQHVREGHGATVCYLDDLFSERYRGMLQAAKRNADVDLQALGNFGTHVPAVVRPLAQWQPTQRALLRWEQSLVRRSEDRTVHRLDTTLLINEHEAALLRQRSGLGPDRVRAIPPLLGHRPPIVREYRGAPEFLFLGQLSLTHNEDGLRFFLSDIWPLVLAARPDARLTIVGRDARAGLIASARRHADSVDLLGYVPELTTVLSRTAALVNPLRFGSGVKLKMIEALSGGVPIVSTSIGADGVTAGAEHGVVLGDTPSDFARAMLETTEPSHNIELSEAAREHFEVSYSRQAVFTRYDEAFGLG